MPNFCAVVGCSSNSLRDEVSFFRFPSIYRGCGTKKERVNPIAVERRIKWVQALRRENLTESILKSQRVCSKHFISGRPATNTDVTNPDWVPSVQMGYEMKKTHAALVQELQLEKKKPDNLAPSYSIFPESAIDESVKPPDECKGDISKEKKDESENYKDLAIAVNELVKSRDNYYYFGQFVAGEIRSLSTDALRLKLQKAIQIMIVKISNEDPISLI